MNLKKMKQEALTRLKLMNAPEAVILRFLDNAKRMCSVDGVAEDLDPDLEALVNKLEEEQHFFAYHIIHDFTPFGELYTILYVSRYEEEWEQDRLDLKEGYPLVYAHNVAFPICSEFGSAEIAVMDTGIVRVG